MKRCVCQRKLCATKKVLVRNGDPKTVKYVDEKELRVSSGCRALRKAYLKKHRDILKTLS